MEQGWSLIVDFTWISFFFVVATMVKSRIRFFHHFIIPTSIIAGFLGLFLGPELLNIAHFNIDSLGNMVYHLMAIGFIALSLKEREKKKSKDYTSTGLFIVSGYLVQGIVGLSTTLILAGTFLPNLFPPLGLLLPLGFGQGPGQAYSIGRQWEELGLTGGGNLGLTIATIGFLWAIIVGVIILNLLKRKGVLHIQGGELFDGKRMMIREEIRPDEIPLSDAHDKLSFQLAIIGFIYLITYFSILAVTNYLITLGTYGETLSQLLWGFHFLIGSVYAILFRLVFDKLNKKGFAFYNKPNNYLLQRVAGSSFDFMITASIAAISFYALRTYLIPILIITTLGGIATVYHSYYISKRIYTKDQIENFLGFYGMQTGTISTGMALLRGVDPKFQTNVSENLVMGSAVAVIFGIPLMFILNIPIVGFKNGEPMMYIYTLLLLIGYLAFMYLLLFIHVRNKKLSLGMKDFSSGKISS